MTACQVRHQPAGAQYNVVSTYWIESYTGSREAVRSPGRPGWHRPFGNELVTVQYNAVLQVADGQARLAGQAGHS